MENDITLSMRTEMIWISQSSCLMDHMRLSNSSHSMNNGSHLECHPVILPARSASSQEKGNGRALCTFYDKRESYHMCCQGKGCLSASMGPVFCDEKNVLVKGQVLHLCNTMFVWRAYLSHAKALLHPLPKERASRTRE